MAGLGLFSMLRTISSLLFPPRLRGSAWEGAECKRHSDARHQSDKCYGLNIWVLGFDCEGSFMGSHAGEFGLQVMADLEAGASLADAASVWREWY